MVPLRNVGRVLALGRADRRLLLRAYAGLGLMELGLRTVGFRRVVRRAQAPIRAPRVPRAEDLARARRYAHWLDVASRHHVVRARCLHRSLVLHWWLRREGLPSELRIGVLKERDALTAHDINNKRRRLGTRRATGRRAHQRIVVARRAGGAELAPSGARFADLAPQTPRRVDVADIDDMLDISAGISQKPSGSLTSMTRKFGST